MRIVTRKSVEAFLGFARAHEKPTGGFTLGNTSVNVEMIPGHSSVFVCMLLRGHPIARAKWAGPTLHRIDFTLAGWNTNTTKERVNGLLWAVNSGCSVHSKDYRSLIHYRTRIEDAIYEGEAYLDPNKWYTLIRDRDGGYCLDLASLDEQHQEHLRRQHAEALVEA